MTLLATFKHISSKNADYGAAEAYLTFEHDEFTMKPTLDENGRLIPREDYRISSLNCEGEDFAVACMRANLRYEKNQKREDVYEAVTATFTCAGNEFTAKGKTILTPGWKEIERRFKASFKTDADEDAPELARELPEITEGQTFDPVEASITEHFTTPPKPYTDVIFCERKEWIGIEERSSA